MSKKQKRQIYLRKKKIEKRKQRKQKSKMNINGIYQNMASPNNQPIQINLKQNLLSGKYHQQFEQIIEKNILKANKYYYKPQQEQNNQSKSEADEEQKKIFYQPKQSRKKKKMLRWLKVAHLKAIASRPDLVQAWDITAYDPLFLVYLKSVKNTVPVPRHWNQKSKFLQTKRGILKTPFKLPQYIQSTGISKLRDPFTESGQKMVKQRLRQRMNPKLGKIDIDYNVLHDAFFKYQTKPKMTIFGDIYYQGKQDEAKAKLFRPGVVSQELRHALGIGEHSAPPWIINIQRYGHPPSYPTLRLLGSNPNLSDVNSYSMLSKAQLQQASRKSGHPGLYASFKAYYEQEQIQGLDKTLWGQIQQEQIQYQQNFVKQNTFTGVAFLIIYMDNYSYYLLIWICNQYYYFELEMRSKNNQIYQFKI